MPTSLSSQRTAVRYQLIQDSLDILLPAGSLGYHQLDDGVLGLVGYALFHLRDLTKSDADSTCLAPHRFASSLMGLRTQINKVLGVK